MTWLNPEINESNTTIDSCHSDTIYFEQEVLPILTSNCAYSGCHDQGSAEDDIVLTTYETLIESDIVSAFKAQ